MYKKHVTGVQIPVMLWSYEAKITGRVDAIKNVRRALFYLEAHAETTETVGFVRIRVRNMNRELRITRWTIYRALERLLLQELIQNWAYKPGMHTLNFTPQDHEQLETFEEHFGEVP